MARIKRAVHARKKKNAYFKAAKGYRGGRGRLWRTVKDAVERAREYSYRDRKVRKRDYRQLWIIYTPSADYSGPFGHHLQTISDHLLTVYIAFNHQLHTFCKI